MAGSVCSIADCVAALPGNSPSGADAMEFEEWPELTEARREEQPDPARVDRKVADWRKAEELASAILANKSKDVRVAIYLLEAKVKRYAFAGLRDGLIVLRSLIEQFWELGLHPLVMEGGDPCDRGRPLLWLENKLPLLLVEVPLTNREGGANYSFAQFRGTKEEYFARNLRTPDSDGGWARQQGKEAALARGEISGEMFDAAVNATRGSAAERALNEFKEAATEFALLERVLANRVLVRDDDRNKEPLGLGKARKLLDEIGEVLADIVQKARPDGTRASPPPSETLTDTSERQVVPPVPLVPAEATTEVAISEGWEHAERLIREGKVEQALAEMTRLAAAEHGRVRFQRRLTLAEICLRTKRETLAAVILEELNEQIKNLHLEQWESPELICRVWGNLYRCYEREESTKEKSVELYRQLCRLDPWQALQWEA